MQYLARRIWIPVCPEQLGGLPTPRKPAEIEGGDGGDVLDGRARVVDVDGRDVTRFFIHGARQCLRIVQEQGISRALLKARSPSCGLKPRIGVTAALLCRHGIEVVEF